MIRIFGSTIETCTFSRGESESLAAQLCPTLCDPMDCRLPGSSIHGIFQARVLEWVAISFSRGSSRPRDWTRVSHIVGRHFTIWATREVPFSRRNEYKRRDSNARSHLLLFSHVWLFVTPWIAACQDSLTFNFSIKITV